MFGYMKKTKEKQEFAYSVNYRVMHHGDRLPPGSYSVELDGDYFMFTELFSPNFKPYDDDLYDTAKKVLLDGPSVIVYGKSKSKNDLLREFVLAARNVGVIVVIVLSAPHLEITADMFDVYTFDNNVAVMLDIDYFEGEEQMAELVSFVSLLDRLKVNYIIISRAEDPRLQILLDKLGESETGICDYRMVNVDDVIEFEAR